jgi:hypothetical protein
MLNFHQLLGRDQRDFDVIMKRQTFLEMPAE